MPSLFHANDFGHLSRTACIRSEMNRIIVLGTQQDQNWFGFKEAAHLQAKESFAKMQPPEVRILKHLISIDSPAQRAEEMRNAFTPGPELETEQQDFLHT